MSSLTQGVVMLSTVSAQLSADVTLPVAGVYYDGPSVNLTAGTWLLIGSVNVYNSSVGIGVEARLWDGTTVAASGEAVGVNPWQPARITLAEVVTVSAPTTYKMSAAASVGGSILQAAQLNNSSGNTASTLVGLKVA